MFVTDEDLNPLKQFCDIGKLKQNVLRSFRELKQDTIDDLIWNMNVCPNCWVLNITTPLVEFNLFNDRAEYNRICLFCSFNTSINYDSKVSS